MTLPKPAPRLVVVGLGYVGLPVAATFAHAGMQVTGLDVDGRKVAAVQAGQVPFTGDEPGLGERVAATVKAGRLRASTDSRFLDEADAVIVCVQTPFDTTRDEPDYTPLRSALAVVGRHLRKGMLVVVESTLAPTTMDRVVRPALESASGLRAGPDFHLGNCPERVMPGKLLRNLESYDRVLGGIDAASHAAMAALYSRIVKGRLDPVPMLTAEVVKAFENTYRDVEIAIANEFARYCDAVGVDFFQVRELVNRVEGRNLHLPGAGVGGHCIPKDTYLLAYGSKGRFTPELMLMARKVNDGMPSYMARKVLDGLAANGRDARGAVVAVLGLSYLGDSDDVRNSPTEPFVREMEAAGADVRVHDPLADGHPGLRPERDLEAAVRGADATALFTAHTPYRAIDLQWLRGQVRTPVLVDGRHVWSRTAAERAGFWFSGVGH